MLATNCRLEADMALNGIRDDNRPGTPYDFNLSLDQQRLLLRIAREAVTYGTVADENIVAAQSDDDLSRPAAVFVTLWDRSIESLAGPVLRGCIGQVRADSPLYRAVQNAAAGAARRDPRFPPVTVEETGQLSVEIAILTQPSPVKDIVEIEIGRDGLLFECDGRRGLLLPKVATRLGWNKSEFVKGVCIKAGLPENTWPVRGRLARFQTFLIQE